MTSFDTTTNFIDNVDEDNNDNADLTNDCLDIIKSNNNGINKTEDVIINILQLIKIKLPSNYANK